MGVVPDGSHTRLHKLVGNLLGVFHRHRHYSYSGVVMCYLFPETVYMENRLALDGVAHNRSVDIEPGHDVETVTLQALVGHESGAERTNADYHGAVFAVKSEEVLQSPLELLHVISYAGLALDVEHRKVLGYLCGVYVYFLGDGSG